MHQSAPCLRRGTCLLTLLGTLLLGLPDSQSKEYLVVYLGGQSNMDGFGRLSELPEELKQPVAGIPIFHGNIGEDGKPVDGRGIWSTLQPGHGVGFTSDGQTNKLSDRLGVELTLGLKLRELLPQANIALIKYSRGGTSLDERAAAKFGCWEPDFKGGEGDGAGINQYDHFLATIRAATAVSDIDGDGEADKLVPIGIVWMQGESDAAVSEEIAQQYHAHLKRMMDLIRAALRQDDLPVAIGRISDSKKKTGGKVWVHGDIVRAQQAAFCEADSRAKLITSTDEYGYSDPYHYDTAGYLDLGRQFAAAIVELQPAGK